MPSSPSPKPREEIAYAELHPYLNPLHPINIHREPGDHIPEGVLNVKPVKHMKVIWSEEKKSENEAEEDEWEEEKTWKRPEAYIRMLPRIGGVISGRTWQSVLLRCYMLPNGYSVGLHCSYTHEHVYQALLPLMTQSNAITANDEESLIDRVEYDMDAQDIAWLELYNADREAEKIPLVTQRVFEEMVDKLEKEWYALTKDLQRSSQEEIGPEESNCNICNDGECENSNAIVFCDGCNVAVHQECYGVPFIPEAQWLCRKCMLLPEVQVRCMFCPVKGGAFKQTINNKWAHLLCALWIPEAGIGNPIYMEPIDTSQIPKSRWKLTCNICKRRDGACIQCYKQNCFTAFHVTCARYAGWHLDERNAHSHGAEHKAFCDKHTEGLRARGFAIDTEINADGEDDANAPEKTYVKRIPPLFSPSVNKHQVWKKDKDGNIINPANPNPAVIYPVNEFSRTHPLIPVYIVTKLEKVRTWINLRKRNQVIYAVAKYWTLKRMARRGAPLLKRLHLESWSSEGAGTQNEEYRKEKLQSLKKLRTYLETARMMIEMTKKREKIKSQLAVLLRDFCLTLICPLQRFIGTALGHITALDKPGLFAEPVNEQLVKDYRTVITKPMDFATIAEKVQNLEYDGFEDFEADINLICTNAMTYNKPDTPYYKAAQKIHKRARDIIQLEIDAYAKEDIPPDTGSLNQAFPPNLWLPEAIPVAGHPVIENVVEQDKEPIQINITEGSQLGSPNKRSDYGDENSSIGASAKRTKLFTLSEMRADNANYFEPGTLVWAKVQGHPWYPGEIMDPTAPDACASQAYAQYDENKYMVRYLDFEAEEDRSWSCMEYANLQSFGDAQKDSNFIYQCFSKKRSQYQRLLESYRRGCDLDGIDSRLGINASANFKPTKLRSHKER